MRILFKACSICFIVFLPSFANAQQQRQPSQIQDAIDAAYAAGLQTGQSVSAMIKEHDDRLKWVLDNWVPKQQALPKQ